MKKNILLQIAFCLIIAISLSNCSKKDDGISDNEKPITPENPIKTEAFIYPNKEWKDTKGKVINAHAGGLYFENDTYYWYGEHKLPGSAENRGFTGGGMHCYKSKDLINWEDVGLVLSVDYNNANADMVFGCIFQRPKVIYNSSTKKYVALFKLYLKGDGYNICHTGVAIATSPEGPFVYSHKFLPSSVNGAGDHTFFKDTNGNMYHITVRKSDRVLVMAKMSDDYLNPATAYVPVPGIQVSTEAPAIFYKSGTYHLLGSGSSGWDPNPPRYYTSTSISGPWVRESNPTSGLNPITGLGPDKTFGGQSTHIEPVQGKDNAYIAMFDEWTPTDAFNSKYIWLPFKVGTNNKLSINWVDKWNLSWFNGN